MDRLQHVDERGDRTDDDRTDDDATLVIARSARPPVPGTGRHRPADDHLDDDCADDDIADDIGAPPRREPLRSAARIAGELLLTFGVVVLLFVVYELWVTDLFAAHDQSRLSDTVHTAWQQHPDAPLPANPAVGTPIAEMYIPRLGADWARVVVEGTDQPQLAQGPGHYTGTAMPGQQGDFAVAGHRVGKGSPFLDLDKVRPGDAVVVETASRWFVYRVLPTSGDPSGIPGKEVVQPTALQVISPTPDAAATAPASGAYLTITTCNPKYSASTRLVVHARLAGTPLEKSAYPDGPPALTGR